MGKSKEIFMEEREAEVSPSPLSKVSNDITQYIRPVLLTKSSASDSAGMIADMVWNGNANPLDVSTKLQWMAEVIERARKLIQEDCVTEIGRHQNGKAEINGAKVERAETGTKYDYSTSKDPVWMRLDQAALSASEAKKARETFLKSLPEPMTIADPDTGEMIEIVKPQKTSTTNIKISFHGE